MILCVCKAIPEKEVERLIENGNSTVEQLQSACGAGTDCGSCRFRLHRLVKAVVDKKTPVKIPTAN